MISGDLTRDLEDLLGADGFVALTEAFGGVRLYVPNKIDCGHDIARAIGSARAQLLSRRFAPSVIRVPLAREYRARHYRARGDSNPMIARRLGMTEPGVEQLFRRLGDDAARRNQLSLF